MISDINLLKKGCKIKMQSKMIVKINCNQKWLQN